MGIYYTRSTSGTTWTTPKRVNPSKQHAQRMGIAAAGSRVYVAWVSQTRVTNFRPTAPRVLYVRVNTSHGAATSWRSTVRLTPTSGRVDYPTVAASGYDAYIAYTDSLTGAVRLAISHDRGLSWTKRSIGSTTATTSQGRIGLPSVAVSGANVVVAWISDGSGSVSVRRSTDRGASWTPVEVITDTNVSAVSAAARGNRVAVVWTTGSEIHVRVATDGAWGPDRLVGGTGQGAQFAYSPAVALQGDSRLAVAWAEQLEGDFGWARLHWTESANDGALWFQTQTLASTSSSSRRSNDWPSILWPFESTRQVLWNGWTYGTNNYRLYLRTGIGSPIGPALAAEGALGPVTRVAPIGSGEDVDSGGHEALDQRGRRDH